MDYEKILMKIIDICQNNDIKSSELGAIIMASVPPFKFPLMLSITLNMMEDIEDMEDVSFSNFDINKFDKLVHKNFPNRSDFFKKVSILFDEYTMRNVLLLLNEKYGNIFNAADLELDMGDKK